MAGPTYILIHVFGTVRDELDREDRGKRTYSAWLREYVSEQPQRLTEIAWVVDHLTENGWRVIGSPYDCDVMLDREISRQTAEEELRRAEVWDRLVRIASPTTTARSSGASIPRASRQARGDGAGCGAPQRASREAKPTPHPLGDELTELHVHLGGSVDPAAMWGIAAKQGIRLPTKDYWEFVDLITVGKRERKSFEDFLALYRWTELIQSSPLAVEESVTDRGRSVSKATSRRSSSVQPVKQPRGRAYLAHIIMASIAPDRVMPSTGQAGLIFSRPTFTTVSREPRREGVAYRPGVRGIDIAPTEPRGLPSTATTLR